MKVEEIKKYFQENYKIFIPIGFMIILFIAFLIYYKVSISNNYKVDSEVKVYQYLGNDKKYTYDAIVSDKMTKIELPYTLHWKNVSPIDNSEVWASGTIEFPVRIYNTPQKPILSKKGNGTSNIYIVMPYEIDDDELFGSEYRYSFQFGQGIDNFDSVFETDSVRWFRYEDVPIDPWVRSVWHYDDFSCCSDRVFLSGGTRAESALIYIFNANGKIIHSFETFEELTPIDCIKEMNLSTGLYLISIEGNLNKIYVK